MDKQTEQQSTRETDEQRVRKLIAESGAKRLSINAYLGMIAWYQRLEASAAPPPPRQPQQRDGALVGNSE